MSVALTKPDATGDRVPPTTPAPPREPHPRRRRLAPLRHAAARVHIGMSRHRALVAAVTGAVWTLVAVVRMLWPTPVGLGDAGDGQRLLCQVGVAPPTETMGVSTGFLDLHWEPRRYYGETCGVPTTGEHYLSSQLVLLRIAAWLGSVSGLPAGLDLRVLAVLCALLIGVGVAAMVLTLPPALSAPMRVVVASVAGLIMVDPGFARFYASPYSEPAALLGVFLLIPAVLWLTRQRRYSWGPLLAVAGTGAFAILAKTQMISLLPVVVAVLLLRPSLPPRWHAGIQRHRSHLVRRLWLRGPGLLLAVLLTTTATVNFANQPQRYAEINSYSQIFATMLPKSTDPEGDLRWFGLDPALARGAGTNIYSPNTVAYEPTYEGFADAVSPGKVVMFYLSRPGRLVELLDLGMRGMAGYGTETYMANYTEAAGMPPYARESRTSVLSWVAGAHRALPWLFAIQWLVMLVVCWVVTKRWRGTPGRQSLGVLGLFLIGAATIQFWAVMLSEGNNEIFKHMIVVDLLMFLTIPVLLAMWLARRRIYVDAPDRRERTT